MTEKIRNKYPRPDFRRDSYINLNGLWDFSFDDANIGLSERWYLNKDFSQKIVVPFTYLSKLSGINNTEFHDTVWYKRSFSYEKTKSKRLILHFGAIDYIADIYVDGLHVTHHEGGATPIACDITDELSDKSEHVITVRAYDDSFDFEMPRGKQFWKRESESIFYTRTVGIWQTVWLEEVTNTYIDYVKIVPDLDERSVEITINTKGSFDSVCDVKVSLREKEIASDSVSVKKNKAKIKIWLDNSVTLDWNHQESWAWSPDNPVLFDLKLILRSKGEEDCVKCYFGFRKIEILNGKIMLNNRPLYMKMLLDQGYFRESLLTAPDDDAFSKDIISVKKMGFNGVRKHQKVEDPLFLYEADRLGLLVWGESPSFYEYSEKAVARQTNEWLEILKRDINHPSIIAWVPLNESWGVQEILNDKREQAHSLSMYQLIKSIDESRLVISNDGWTHTKSDIYTIHDYEGKGSVLEKRYSDVDKIMSYYPGGRAPYAKGYEYQSEPIMVTEFGGISCKADKDVGWGYTSTDSEEELLSKFKEIVTPLLKSDKIQGFCYTQLTDVEQEVNGLMTYDREFKISPEKIRGVLEGTNKEE